MSTEAGQLHLLSGVARCGVCGATLRVALNRRVPSYRCSEHGCVTRRRQDLDELVTAVVVQRLARPDAAGLFITRDTTNQRAALAEAEELRGRLDHAADQYAEGAIDGRQLERITARLRPQLAEAEKRLRTVDSAPLLDGLVGAPDVGAVWAQLPLSRRRAVVNLLLEIRVHRTRQGTRTFDPAAVQLIWRTGS